MAVEAKRGCGFRKVGGLYLMGEMGSRPCDRLPLELTVCRCCGEGIKQTRGWRWIDPAQMFDGYHGTVAIEVPGEDKCECPPECPVCNPADHFDGTKAGLLWVGHGYYKTPQDFMAEGAAQGISRRISTLPIGFRVGETWVFLAHPKAFPRMCDDDGADGPDVEMVPGIFMAFRPRRIERIVLSSEMAVFQEIVRIRMQANAEFEFDEEAIRARQVERFGEAGMEIFRRLQADATRGITLVPVPDDDPDHRGRNVPSYGAGAEEEGDE